MSVIDRVSASYLRQLIYYHLDHGLDEDAHFLAGRLQALSYPHKVDSCAHLLGLTALRLRRFQLAYDSTAPSAATGDHLGCAYVFAQACLQLGQEIVGLKALENARELWEGKNEWENCSENARRHEPDAPAVWTLKAKLWASYGDFRKAGDCYIEAHKLNPLIWAALDGLCRIGADLQVENMFHPHHNAADMAQSNGDATTSAQIYVDEDSRPPLAPHAKHGQQKAMAMFGDLRSLGKKALWPRSPPSESALRESYRPVASEWDTPVANPNGLDDDIAMGGTQVENDDVFGQPPAAPSRRPRQGEQFDASDRMRQPALRGQLQSVSEGAASDDSGIGTLRKPSSGGYKRSNSGQVAQATADAASQPRRSNRLGTQTTSRMTRSAVDSVQLTTGRADPASRTAKVATGTKGRTGIVGRVVSGNRKVLPPSEQDKEKRAPSRAISKASNHSYAPSVVSSLPAKEPTVPTQPDTPSMEEEAMNFLLGYFRQLAGAFYALSRFDLPNAIEKFGNFTPKDTPFVLAQIGLAYYEAANYKSAEIQFSRLRKVCPSRVEDMDVYSTVLWHLKKETELAGLCHTLRERAFEAPQTWVAVGNAFSLSREHDQAINAFKRATQCDPKYAYAYVLLGHEYVSNEAYDLALTAFRRSVAIDRRCYGGWYGLGKSYERLGKLDDAEKHYRIAAYINPSNPTLLVCIGVVIERLGKKEAALAQYNRALDLQPQSQLARFKKARVLMHMKEYNLALLDLEILRSQAPEEANVWFLLGKCYRGMDDKAEAIKCLTSAMNLDPKAQPYIKDVMDAIENGEEDSDGD